MLGVNQVNRPALIWKPPYVLILGRQFGTSEEETLHFRGKEFRFE